MQQRDFAVMAKRRADMAYPHADIGRRLKQLREALGLNQSEMARSIGLKPHTYNPWETGERRPKLESALLLREKYGVTLDWIYCGEHKTLEFPVQRTLGLIPTGKKPR